MEMFRDIGGSDIPLILFLIKFFFIKFFVLRKRDRRFILLIFFYLDNAFNLKLSINIIDNLVKICYNNTIEDKK